MPASSSRATGGQFRLTTAQSPLGQALYRHYGLDTQHFETNLVLTEGRAYGKLEAAAIVLRRLPAPWPLMGRLLLMVPPPLRDRLYDPIARNRYRLFGRHETCMVPPADWKARMLA